MTRDGHLLGLVPLKGAAVGDEELQVVFELLHLDERHHVGVAHVLDIEARYLDDVVVVVETAVSGRRVGRHLVDLEDATARLRAGHREAELVLVGAHATQARYGRVARQRVRRRRALAHRRHGRVHIDRRRRRRLDWLLLRRGLALVALAHKLRRRRRRHLLAAAHRHGLHCWLLLLLQLLLFGRWEWIVGLGRLDNLVALHAQLGTVGELL